MHHKMKYLTRFQSKLCNWLYHIQVCVVWDARSMTSWLGLSSLDREFRIRALARALRCFFGKDTTQVYKCVPAN